MKNASDLRTGILRAATEAAEGGERRAALVRSIEDAETSTAALEATARAMTGEWLQGRLAPPAPAGDSAAPPVRGVPAAVSP